MTNTLTIESCTMKWEGGHMAPILTPLGAFESFSMFNIYQHYLEAIPTKFHVSSYYPLAVLILVVCTRYDLYCNRTIIQYMGGRGAYAPILNPHGGR